MGATWNEPLEQLAGGGAARSVQQLQSQRRQLDGRGESAQTHRMPKRTPSFHWTTLGVAAGVAVAVPTSTWLEYYRLRIGEQCRELCAVTPLERHHGGHLHLEMPVLSTTASGSLTTMIDMAKARSAD